MGTVTNMKETGRDEDFVMHYVSNGGNATQAEQAEQALIAEEEEDCIRSPTLQEGTVCSIQRGRGGSSGGGRGGSGGECEGVGNGVCTGQSFAAQ